MNDEQMTQDTQTPQQPQWQWVEDDDFPAYVLQAPDGYRWRITKEFGHPDELLRRINAAVNRAERIVTLEAALREMQQDTGSLILAYEESDYRGGTLAAWEWTKLGEQWCAKVRALLSPSEAK